MKRFFALMMALMILLALTACGESESDDPNCGVYYAATGEMFGISVKIEDIYSDGFGVELKGKGKCEIHVDGQDAKGTWTIEGNAFTLEAGGVELSGTLEDGVMVAVNMMDSGLDMVFLREGTEMPDREAVDGQELLDSLEELVPTE